VRDVEPHRLPPDLFRDLLGATGVQVADDDGRGLGRQATRDRRPDPARAPGHQRPASLEPHGADPGAEVPAAAITNRSICCDGMAEPIPIIGGTGALGWGLALRLATAGQPVVIGSRSAERAREAE